MAVEKGQIGVPAAYFLKMAKADYNDYEEALCREFVQNSVDAGAKNVQVSFEEGHRIVVADDGCGMSKGTLTDRLLVLGGSKKGVGSVGAFGKAKELLFFSWEAYSISTWRDGEAWLVKGVGGDYTIEPQTSREGSGTIVSIDLPKGANSWRLQDTFRMVMERMQVKSSLYLNGEKMTVGLYRGTLRRTIDSLGRLYQTKCRDSSYVNVRVDGIWMFQVFVGRGSGELVLELDRKSVECMTSNRDGLKGQYRMDLEAMVKELSVNKSSALRDKPKIHRELIEGEGPVEIPFEDLDEAEEVSEEVMNQIAERFENEGEAEVAKIRMRQMLPQYSVSDAQGKKRILEFLGYKPDFVVDYQVSRLKTIQNFMGGFKARTLAIMWTETVRQVLMDIKLIKKFTAGFTFDKGVEAVRSKTDDGTHLFMVNPMNLGELLGITGTMMYSDRKLLMVELLDRAIHEVAHILCEYHDEDFVSEMSRIRLLTARSEEVYAQISKIKG